MPTSHPQILAIVNVTRDSFSDGGHFLNTDRALAHARALLAEGADILDLGAQSTHPDAESVDAETEIARLDPLIRALHADGATLSIDTYRPAVMQHALEHGVALINDVTAGRDPAIPELLADHTARILIMHSTSPEARARRAAIPADTILDRILRFFEQRIAAFEAAGVRRDRLILDPGMGMFLSRSAQASVVVLQQLQRLRQAFDLPLCVSPARKSFLGVLLGDRDAGRPPAERDAATLAAELFAARQGADYLRTHRVAPLKDALTIWRRLEDG
jgi:dihydropteroate synthase type 2